MHIFPQIEPAKMPWLIGANHYDKTVTRATVRAVAENGARGRILFVEGHPGTLVPDNPNARPFFAAMEKARELGMRIVFLDHPHSDRVDNAKERLLNYVREKAWVQRLLKRAGPDDIVLMHQDHLWSIQQVSGLYFVNSPKIRYISEPDKSLLAGTWDYQKVRGERMLRNQSRPLNRLKKPRVK